jgi:hypothetical protein
MRRETVQDSRVKSPERENFVKRGAVGALAGRVPGGLTGVW